MNPAFVFCQTLTGRVSKRFSHIHWPGPSLLRTHLASHRSLHLELDSQAQIPSGTRQII